ncbi:MAG: UDP-3-O-(3-hydroxymyristoyl)glucosamine N-acyltransferase [Bacteroidales bacterium]|nr:UDP-3-O-(3-hydroxymyristoyl)glucosamine N-acyltransferase [Bacteroidales bacterium]
MKFDRIYTVDEISKLIDVQYFGDSKIQVLGINEIHSVEQGDITFVDHPKYYSKALNSDATIIIINSKVDVPDGKVILLSDDPFADYQKIVQHFRIFSASNQFIAPTATIGKDTIIQPGVFIGNYVKIGDNCLIHSNVSIYDYTELGNNVVIHSQSVIGADAYYFQKKNGAYRKMHSCGKVIIEDNVEIGALCAIDKGVSSDTIIGNGTKMDNHVQVGHDTVIGKNCLIGSQVAIAGVTNIEDDVLIWAKVGINKDITIGKGAVILATSNVDKSLEGGITYFGSPATEARQKWKEIVALNRLAKNNT